MISTLASRQIVIDETKLKNILKSSDVYIAKSQNGNIVGLACLVKIQLLQGTQYLIESVIVPEEYRNKGIATHLIEHLKSVIELKSATHVSLTCNPNRINARRLYKKLGFSIADTNVFRYYTD